MGYEAKDPNVPPNIAFFHYKEKEFKKFKAKGGNYVSLQNMCIHFKMDGILILKDGEEAKEQNIKDPEEEEPVELDKEEQNELDEMDRKMAEIEAKLNAASAEPTAEEIAAAAAAKANGEAEKEE